MTILMIDMLHSILHCLNFEIVECRFEILELHISETFLQLRSSQSIVATVAWTSSFLQQSWWKRCKNWIKFLKHAGRRSNCIFCLKRQNTRRLPHKLFMSRNCWQNNSDIIWYLSYIHTLLASTGALIAMMVYYISAAAAAAAATFSDFQSVHWCNWCYKCHSKSLKQYQCNWCHKMLINTDWMSKVQMFQWSKI